MKQALNREISALVIGASAGGVQALTRLLPKFGKDTKFAIICVIHLPPDAQNLIPEILKDTCSLVVKEAESTEDVKEGIIYIAPPGYHLSVEPNRRFSLSTEEPVHYCRPAIDVLFSSAATVFKKRLVGILLTGANSDGALGLKEIASRGGYTIVQDPDEADFKDMPTAALNIFTPSAIMNLAQIEDFFGSLGRQENRRLNEFK